MKHKSKLFWILLAAAAAVRCIGFVSIPGGVNQDEAMAGGCLGVGPVRHGPIWHLFAGTFRCLAVRADERVPVSISLTMSAGISEEEYYPEIGA